MTTYAVHQLSMDDLIAELRVRRWTLYRWGIPEDPALLAGMFQWPAARQVDVILLRRNEAGSAYRAPLFHKDLFRPPSVLWEFHCGDALWTLRAVLSLPQPGHPGAPRAMHATLGPCAIPDNLPAPTVIRPLGR